MYVSVANVLCPIFVGSIVHAWTLVTVEGKASISTEVIELDVNVPEQQTVDVQIDENTGYAIDPLTGEFLDPETGEPINGESSIFQYTDVQDENTDTEN